MRERRSLIDPDDAIMVAAFVSLCVIMIIAAVRCGHESPNGCQCQKQEEAE